MNILCLTGKVAYDPIIKHNKQGELFAKFILIDSDDDYISAIAFGKAAECMKQIHKNNVVSIRASVKQHKYTDKTGNKIENVEVIAHDVEFVSTKRSYVMQTRT